MVELPADSGAVSSCSFGRCWNSLAVTTGPMNVSRSLLAMAVLSVTFHANADYLWTWHYIYPQFQKFQASFQVTDAEMQSGATFSSDLFHNTIEVNSLS